MEAEVIVLFILAGAILIDAVLAEQEENVCQNSNWLNQHKGEYDLTWY